MSTGGTNIYLSMPVSAGSVRNTSNHPANNKDMLLMMRAVNTSNGQQSKIHSQFRKPNLRLQRATSSEYYNSPNEGFSTRR